MMNNSVGNLIANRKVDVIKMVCHKWLFTITVDKYPDYKLSERIKNVLDQFVESINCKLVECASGTAAQHTLIVAYTVKIEDEENAESVVAKIKEFITANVATII